jgi:hypothetical protein
LYFSFDRGNLLLKINSKIEELNAAVNWEPLFIFIEFKKYLNMIAEMHNSLDFIKTILHI